MGYVRQVGLDRWVFRVDRFGRNVLRWVRLCNAKLHVMCYVVRD
jgi:hypothetical protein